MSSIPESHSFNTEIATALGSVQLALLVHHFTHWIGVNRRLERNLYEGKYWTYQTLDEISATFPYWSRKQVERFMKKLVELGVLEKGNFNSTPYDRTVWYTFTDQFEENFSISRNREIEKPKSGNQNPEIGTPIPDTKTDIETDKKKKKERAREPTTNFGTEGIVKMTQKQYDKLVEEHCKEKIDHYIEAVQDHCLSKNTRYSGYAATVRNFIRRDVDKEGGHSNLGESNQAFAQEILIKFGKIAKEKNLEIYVGPKQIEFIAHGGQNAPTCFEYDKPKFRDKVKNQITTWRLIK